MSSNSSIPHKDPLALCFILTFAISWGIGAFAIFLPAQLQAMFGKHPCTDSG